MWRGRRLWVDTVESLTSVLCSGLKRRSGRDTRVRTDSGNDIPYGDKHVISGLIESTAHGKAFTFVSIPIYCFDVATSSSASRLDRQDQVEKQASLDPTIIDHAMFESVANHSSP